jgi:two-component system alkaline phosphatase synthesis response regulator PhoP
MMKAWFERVWLQSFRFNRIWKCVGEAHNGLDAVKLANKTKPDVILLDMVMPEQDGLATIPKVERDPAR